MKRIFSTLLQKWPEYLLEIFVLVIGIYGAFALDNWNEERKNDEIEQVILNNLKNEILANKAELELTINIHEKSRQSTFEMLKLFGTDISKQSSASLDTLLTLVETIWTFEARNGYVQSVITSGNINILESDTLKTLLTTFDGEVVDATQEVAYIENLIHNRLYPEIDGIINAANRSIAYGYPGFNKGSYVSDYAYFFSNQKIEDIIVNIGAWHINLAMEEQELISYFDALIQLIDGELHP